MSPQLEGTVRDLSRFGEAIVHTEQGPIFASGALPGERVLVAKVRKHGKVTRADRLRIVDASGQRVEPVCPIVARCGGCPLMIASPGLQAKFKRALLEQALAGLPGAESLAFDWVAASSRLGYRRRARWSWSSAGRRFRFGYHPPRSEQIVDVRTCPVLHPVLDRAQAAFRRTAGDFLADVGEAHLAMGEGDRATVALESERPQPPELYRALERLVDEQAVVGAALRAGGARTFATWGAPNEVRRGVDGEPLIGPIAGFSQAHDDVNRELVQRVTELSRPQGRRVLELFAGSGNLTVALAREAASLLAIEQDEAAAEACRANLARRGLDSTVRTADAESFRPTSGSDVAVVDPPRGGAPGAMRRLVQRKVPEIVYVSCDPPTLGRDLRVLAEAGYVLTHATAFDMFPQTAHVESVVRLVLEE